MHGSTGGYRRRAIIDYSNGIDNRTDNRSGDNQCRIHWLTPDRLLTICSGFVKDLLGLLSHRGDSSDRFHVDRLIIDK